MPYTNIAVLRWNYSTMIILYADALYPFLCTKFKKKLSNIVLCKEKLYYMPTQYHIARRHIYVLPCNLSANFEQISG